MTKAKPARTCPRSILWVAALLLLAIVGAHLRLTRCLGSCGQVEPSTAASCCATSATGPSVAHAGCCGCCQPTRAHLPETDPNDRVAAGHADHERNPNGTLTGTCERGCCLTFMFEGIEFAPAPAVVELPSDTAIAFAPLTSNWPTPDCRPLTRGRPFDRGPPRTDRRTAMRACTVLLI